MPIPIAAKLTADVAGFSSGMSKAGASLQNLNSKMLGVSKVAFALSAAITGVGAIAVKTFADFENRMASVGVIAGATESQFAILEDAAKRLGATTLFTARQAADGMEILAKAGFEVNEILTATPAVLNLATAASLELGDAANIVIGIMRGYGKTADEVNQVNDVLVKTFTSTNVTVGDIAETFKLAAPTARTAGIRFEELAAVVGILGNANIKGTTSGTALNQAILAFSAPTPKAIKQFKRLGLEVLDASGKMRPLNEIVDQFSGETGPALLKSISDIIGRRAAKAFAVLSEVGGQSIRDLTAELDNAKGTSKDVADTMEKTLSGQFTILKSKVEAVALSIGERLEPVLREVLTGAQKFVDAILALDAGTKNTILRIALLTAGISGLIGILALVGGALLLLVGLATGGVATIVIAFAPLIAIVSLVALLAVELKRAWDENLAGVKSTTLRVVGVVKRAFEDLKNKLIKIFAGIKRFFGEAMDAIERKTKKVLKKLGLFKPTIGLAIAGAGAALGAARAPTGLGEDRTLKDKLTDQVKGALGRVGEDFEILFGGIFSLLKKVIPPAALQKIKGFADALKGLLNKVGKGSTKAEEAGAGMAGVFAGAVKIALSEIAQEGSNLSRALQAAKESFKELGRTIKNVAGPQIKGAIGGLAGQVLKGAEEGAKVGGIKGAAVGAILALVLASKQFARLLAVVNLFLQSTADFLGKLIEPLIPVISIFLKLFSVLRGLLVGFLLIDVVLVVLRPLFKALFDVLRFFGISLLKIIRFVQKSLGRSTKKTDEQLKELRDSTFETEGQLDDLGDAAAAASEALFNVPQGFKVAAERFAAQAPEDGGARDGDRGPSGPGPPGGTDPTRGGFGKGPGRFGGPLLGDEPLGPLGTSEGEATSADGGDINIFVTTDDPVTFVDRVQDEIDRRGIARRGLPGGQTGGQFSTRRGSA